VTSNALLSPTQQSNLGEEERLKHRQELKNVLKRSSIVEDEDEDRPRYQKLYQSGVRAVTSFKVQDYEQQRTESFRENLDHTEFKKYMEINKKNYKQPSITQRFFNRKSVPR